MGELSPVESAGGSITHTQSQGGWGWRDLWRSSGPSHCSSFFIAGKETVPEPPRITALVIDQPQDWQGWR